MGFRGALRIGTKAQWCLVMTRDDAAAAIGISLALDYSHCGVRQKTFKMIIEDHSHEVEKVESIRPLLHTSLETLRSCNLELPPPYYDPTIPLLGKQQGKRRHIKGFACWLVGLLVAFAMILVSLPRLIQLSSS
jgi:hypothetical protein